MTAKPVTPVVTLADLDLVSSEFGERYASKDRHFTSDMGLTKLGATYTVVPAGKRACPYHVHHAKDEMFVILQGEGEYRFGDKTYRVKAGDVLGAPVGGPEYAHQILNTSDKPLAFIGISSTSEFEIVEYPDSNKFQVIERKGTIGEARFRHIGRAEQTLDYWDGENV